MTLSHTSTTTPSFWRGVLILAGKDIVDAVKNKTILTILLGLSITMLSVQALPLLLQLDERPAVGLYDPARTRIADLLRRDGGLQISELRREADLLNAARNTSGSLLTLHLPENWPQSSGALQVEGYSAHWLRPDTRSAAINQAEAALREMTGREVVLSVQPVYPTPETTGHVLMLSLGFVTVVTLITAIVVPSLLVEEKVGHTLDVLRVSPVSEGQIILGKGLAGLLFGGAAAAVLILFNWRMIVHWEVMLLAVLAGALFGVGIGLLIGVLVEDEGGIQQWVGILSIFLLLPVIAVLIDPSRLPEWLPPLLDGLPTIALYELVRLSLYAERLVGEILLRSGILLLWAAGLWGVVLWRLRRWEVA